MSHDSRSNQNAPPGGSTTNGGATAPAAQPTVAAPSNAAQQWGQVPYGPPPPHQYMPPHSWGPPYWGYQPPYAGMPPPPAPPFAPPMPPPASSAPPPPAARVVYDLTGDGTSTRGARREGGSQSRDREDRRDLRDRGRPPSPPYRRQGNERSRSPPSRRPSHSRMPSPPRLRGRFNDFLDRVDELEQRNYRLERRNEDLTEQTHELRRQLRELQGSRSRNSQAGSSRPTQTNPPVTNTARLSTTAQTTAPTPTSSATSAAAPQPAPIIPITTSTQSTSNRPLEDRLESLPLSRRMELDAPISDPPVENPGGSAPSSSTTFSPGFDWNGHLINSVDDYHSIRDAANRGSDSALLHIGFLNATQQRIPHHLRSAGVKELLKDWAHFSKPHEAKRIRLHEKHGIKLRTKSRRTSDTQDDAPSSQISERVLDNPIAMDTDAAPNPDQPPPVPAPVSGHTSDRERGPIALQDAPMAQADESRLSVVGLQFADMNPEDWPPGIRADIDGQPVTISADMLRVPHTPYADDVHAWEVRLRNFFASRRDAPDAKELADFGRPMRGLG
ncbi:hypothetical protein HWV62_10309 [Athelia sp. TMB]|nr:hypothetical protein HWV62_10309 [Athelia sp. TMB]